MSYIIDRRRFTLSSLGLAATAALPRAARAQTVMRQVTTPFGSYEIPANPQRVIAVDSRLDMQPALALGLPVVGYSLIEALPWVPVPANAVYLGGPINVEAALALDPDLIICSDYGGEWWPHERLRAFAPILPLGTEQSWKQSMADLAGWLGLQGNADAALAEYDAGIADIRTRHAEKIANRRVVSVQADRNIVWPMNGSTTLHTQVLADLGALTISPEEGQRYEAEGVAAENFTSFFADIDGILLSNNEPAELEALMADPLWQRVPAVQAGAFIASNGNVNYGGIYSARHLVGLFDALYARIR